MSYRLFIHPSLTKNILAKSSKRFNLYVHNNQYGPKPYKGDLIEVVSELSVYIEKDDGQLEVMRFDTNLNERPFLELFKENQEHSNKLFLDLEQVRDIETYRKLCNNLSLTDNMSYRKLVRLFTKNAQRFLNKEWDVKLEGPVTLMVNNIFTEVKLIEKNGKQALMVSIKFCFYKTDKDMLKRIMSNRPDQFSYNIQSLTGELKESSVISHISLDKVKEDDDIASRIDHFRHGKRPIEIRFITN